MYSGSRLLNFEWFDKLATNEKKIRHSRVSPFALSMSKGERRFFQQPIGLLPFVLFALLLSGCGGTMDDLNPSGSDKRTPVVAGTTGPGVGQNAPDFTLSDTLGTSVNLRSELSGTTVKGVVLYFTMWCPLCETHMTQMRDTIIPLYPDVTFFAIDYVSGSVADARAAELNSGLSGSGFRVLADIHQTVATAYQGTMGVTVVIDKTGVIRMNEDFKDGTRLIAALAALP